MKRGRPKEGTIIVHKGYDAKYISGRWHARNGRTYKTKALFIKYAENRFSKE